MRSSSLMAVLVGIFSLRWLSWYQNYNQLASKPQIQFWLFIQNQGNIFGIGDGFFSYWIGNLGNFNHFWVVAGRHEPKSSTSREPTRVLSQKYISKPKMADNGKGWSVKPQNRKFWSFLEPSPVDLPNSYSWWGWVEAGELGGDDAGEPPADNVHPGCPSHCSHLHPGFPGEWTIILVK